MATRYWLGTATAVAQVQHVTPANVEIGDIFKIDLSNDAGESYEISFTATAATVQNVVEGLKAAADVANAAGTPPWDDVTTTEDDTKVIITADTAGTPFYVATTATNGGANDTQTLVSANSVASAGPNDWNAAANWSAATKPVNADSVDLGYSSVDILYGLDQSAVVLADLNPRHDYTGKLGQHVLAASGYLQIGCSKLDIGEYYGSGSPGGSPRIKIDLGTTACTVAVHNTSNSPTETHLPTVRLKANNAATDLHVAKGRVGVACEAPTETSTIDDVHVTYVASRDSDAKVLIGAGVTLDKFTADGGDNTLLAAATTINARAGKLVIAGEGAVTTLTVEGGTVYPTSTGTITTANLYGGTTDFSRSSKPRTVTTTNLKAGATLKYDPDVVTMTNKLTTDEPLTIRTSAA